MKGERIYLDHAATTPTDEAVLREMLPLFSDIYGNASSTHKAGREAVAAIDRARESIARSLSAHPSEIYFTSGGTESDNWAVRGIAKAYPEKGKHIIASSIEHPAVLGALKKLQDEGFTVTYLPVDEKGFVSVKSVESAIREDTVLITVMMVNNEVGTIQPIQEIASLAKAHGILVHTDAVQAAGVIPIDVNSLGVDALSISAHKFYGPKGIGALYLKKGRRIKSLLAGGEQERSLRGGTYNTPAIVGMAAALERAAGEMPKRAQHLATLRDRFLTLTCDLITRNGGEPANPAILNLCFSGVRNNDLLSALDQAGIMASAGSACSSGSTEPSHVLKSMGKTDREIKSSVRFSFGKENTLEEIDKTIAVINRLLPRLRRDTDLFKEIPSTKNNL